MSLGMNTRPSKEPVVARRARNQRPIERPIFVTGLGRSGTTLLEDVLGSYLIKYGYEPCNTSQQPRLSDTTCMKHVSV
jgi:hypothetical protein